MTQGLEFDPGFAPYILAFRRTTEYLYADINRFKNFSQRKSWKCLETISDFMQAV